ncbi:electron transfer flavoprotein subunit beta [candidate division WOR-3 bacterium JGI_Cruoil_03_44_89]|uniref:Electron transfer flavoprotein subunit beta n=1 Tax=candidate division WOR-3 bacterium JGI_Cruoil_03_44_89 TaxID=1973748 RepID=A0A235BR25_UNCW3|nr:MAG: electron transfer flavoprotein subunit beta [candidate division WOR-3 bacterium JGI_Cruoil_03_44_89]
MRIIVCIKQVPDTQDIKIDPDTNTLIREGVPSVMNPLDAYALEEAIRIREKGEAEVIAISMGPPQAEDALREAIGMGADGAVLLTDMKFKGADTLATSSTLGKTIEKIGNYDLILCGKQATDGDTAQVGPEIAEFLGIPQVTYVRKIEEINEKGAVVERMTEWGYQVIETPLPALLTVVKEINVPRLPSLRGKIRAKSAEIPHWGLRDIEVEEEKVGLSGSPTRVIEIFTPERKKSGEKFTGTREEAAEKIIEFLKGVSS